MMQRDEIAVGVIGAGYWGRQLLRVFARTPGLRLAAACDLRQVEGVELPSGVQLVSDPARLCADPAIDALAVATPPATHFEIGRAVLEAGKHCWMEKPLALSAGHARDLVRLAGDHGRTLFVDETFLYDPLVAQAKEWIESGRLGRLLHLSFERLSMGRIRRDSDVWWNSASHDLALLRYLVPDPVTAIRVEKFAHLRPDIADVAVATVHLNGGVVAHVRVSWLSPLKTASVVAVGDAGMLRYEGKFGERRLSFFDYALADADGRGDGIVPIERFETAEVIAGDQREPLALAASAFLESIRSGIPAPSAGQHSARVVELLEAAEAL
jgi:predicted dehydrogenase